MKHTIRGFPAVLSAILCVALVLKPPLAPAQGFLGEKLAPRPSFEPERRLYQRALLLKILEHARAEQRVPGILPEALVRSTAAHFEEETLGSLTDVFRRDFAGHPLWPELVYVRSNGSIVGWFEESSDREASIVEIPAEKSSPLYVWPDRAVFINDFLFKEGPVHQQALLDLLVARGVIPLNYGSGQSMPLTLAKNMRSVLETYSNVHRSSGHFSQVSTELLDEARRIAEKYLDADPAQWTVVFGNERIVQSLIGHLPSDAYRMVTSQELGLPLGLYAVAVKNDVLPSAETPPPNPAGGTVHFALKERGLVEWAGGAEKYEPGTPNIVGVIVFAKALQMVQQSQGKEIFKKGGKKPLSAVEIPDLLVRDTLERYRGEELLKRLAETLVGRDILVPTQKGLYPYINFDNGASTPTFELILAVAEKILTSELSPEAKEVLLKESQNIAHRFLNAPEADYEVLFAGNTSDASNILLRSVQKEARRASQTGERFVVMGSDLEHNSNRLPYLFAKDMDYATLPMSDEGVFDAQAFERMLREYNVEGRHGNQRIRMIALNGASNTLGTINDLKPLIAIAHRYGARFAADAAQLVAHRRIDMEDLGADYLLFSAHKMYAPFGSGALVARKGLLRFEPEELSLIQRSGRENLVGIATMAKSMQLLQRIGMDTVARHEQEMVAHAIAKLQGLGGEEVRIYGITDPQRLAQRTGVVSFTLKKWPRNLVAMWSALDKGGASRIGCFCAAPSVAQALGAGEEYLSRLAEGPEIQLTGPGMVRISFGLYNTPQEIDRFVESLQKLIALPSDAIMARVAGIHAAVPPGKGGALSDEIAMEYAQLLKCSPEEVQRAHAQLVATGLFDATEGIVEAFVQERILGIYGELAEALQKFPAEKIALGNIILRFGVDLATAREAVTQDPQFPARWIVKKFGCMDGGALPEGFAYNPQTGLMEENGKPTVALVHILGTTTFSAIVREGPLWFNAQAAAGLAVATSP